ncbi:transcription factor bHLH162-like isoform X2 [Chenopodium quinoa]|uniref:transcription factor bHLH162-like isoform X2 n=1 Tax=Chenopodium quinoa TaxID=63459 RepID=UPI000B783220|nr:transcription factor bHLH162-like isoform X2 [Chenopodium quinoa]
MKRSSESLLEKNIAHKNERDCINGLCSDLISIIPPQHIIRPSKGILSQANKIEQATDYIVKLRERVDNLSKRKEELLQMTVNDEEGTSSNEPNTTASDNSDATMSNSGLSLPIIKVEDLGSCLEVQLMLELEHNIKLHEVIRVLEEEGAEVVNATFSNNTGNMALHTLHCKARSSRIGVEATRVCARLHELIS